ncbi:MAG: HAD-IC family P-type ATPase [Dehalococcoidales bacterium]|nr:HAD-IC family P-type ATPase [Dehalococcoidales bacterium]
MKSSKNQDSPIPTENPGTNWHNLPCQEALTKTGSRISGLTENEAKERVIRYGANELVGKKQTPLIVVFLRQFRSPMIYVLLAAGIISLLAQFFTGQEHFIDAIVIFGVIVLNAVIGTLQEGRAEKAMEALLEMAAPKAKVRRNGNIETIPARQIAPGDIVLFEAGDKVPADVRLLESANLKVNESALTGESIPVEKQLAPVPEDAIIAERTNMLFMSTIVTSGRAMGVAVLTGMATEIGKIATGLAEVKQEETPLQRNIKKLSRYLVFVFLGVSALLVVVGLRQGLGLFELFMLAISAAVASIPEGLPAVVTVVLAIGMRSMARRNAIIRKLVAVETLGSATVICSDKTGTLTLNQMTVRRIYADGRFIELTGEGYDPKGEFRRDGEKIDPAEDDQLMLLLRAGALCNDASLTKSVEKYGIFGDPTEGALVVAAAKADLNKTDLEKAYPRQDELPFASEKQYMVTLHYMATLHSEAGHKAAFIKGSVEKILSYSRHILKNGRVVDITESDYAAVSEAAMNMGKDALRVIALAYRDFPEKSDKLTEDEVQDNLTLIGLAGMSDPPRQEAKEAVALCKQAGIKVKMITGDNKITAESVAGQIGLPSGRAVTGAELQKMSDEDLANEIKDISVFARIEPLHKMRIVNALKANGEIVAMTGDGVNDAPALKAADIGVAMGIAGTDVSKEASDMVLADDNFASVVSAVDEGRAIFNRLRNVLFYTLNTNLGELVTLILTLVFIGQSPLLAVQILWINLVTDTAGDIPLGMEPKFGDELKQPPRHPGVGLMYSGLFVRTMVMAVLIGLGTFLIFRWAEARMSIDEARTLAFCTIVACEWFTAFSARSDEHTVFRLGIFRNRALVLSIGLAVLLQIAVVYAPFMQAAFGTVPLTLTEWGIVVLAAGGLFAIEELRKVIFPKLYSFGKYKPFKNH